LPDHIRRKQEEEVRRRIEERERREKREAEERQRRETREAAERLLREQRQAVELKWGSFQREKHKSPPTLLPLEAVDEQVEFLTLAKKANLPDDAVAWFETKIQSEARDAQRALERLKHGLQAPSLLNRVLKGIAFGSVPGILRLCTVSTRAPNLGSPLQEAVAAKCRFLRGAWCKGLDPKMQAVFSIHRCAGKCVIHIGSSQYGSAFVTLPHSLEPVALA
jgi:hypothetical protein